MPAASVTMRPHDTLRSLPTVGVRAVAAAVVLSALLVRVAELHGHRKRISDAPSGWDSIMTRADYRRSLRARRCYVGMDLSSTKDLTALAAVFPDDDGFDVLA